MCKSAFAIYIENNEIVLRRSRKAIVRSEPFQGYEIHIIQDMTNGSTIFNAYSECNEKIRVCSSLHTTIDAAIEGAKLTLQKRKLPKVAIPSESSGIKKPKKCTPKNLQRKMILTLDEVFPYVLFEKPEKLGIKSSRQQKLIKGEYIKMSSYRYQLFELKGVQCVSCDVKGEFFAMEKTGDSKRYHLNLYGKKDGQDVLMTKDHILPKSKGGLDNMDNFQPMCVYCNSRKGNKV